MSSPSHEHSHTRGHDHDRVLAASVFASSAASRLLIAIGAAAVLWLTVAWALGWL